MGVIQTLIHDELIDGESDRHSNLLRIYRKLNGEIVIHFRNLKINLLNKHEIDEWKIGFTEALKKLNENNYLNNDL